jgi:hypothetical protein
MSGRGATAQAGPCLYISQAIPANCICLGFMVSSTVHCEHVEVICMYWIRHYGACVHGAHRGMGTLQ